MITKAQDPNAKTKSSTDNTWKITAIVAIVLFVAAAVVAIVYMDKASKLKAELKTERQNVEDFRTELNSVKQENLTLNEKNQTLDQTLDDAFVNITAKEMLIERLNTENATLLTIKNQVAEIQAINKSLNISNAKLNKVQAKINKTIKAKQAANQKLKDKYKIK